MIQSEASEPGKGLNQGPPTARRILVVEDEAIVAHDLQNLLQRLGHRTVGHASSGHEAIRMAEETRPDLVLMDLVLDDGMDGTDAAAEIARHRPVPIIYITANTNRFLCEPTKMVAPFLCIAKPFSAATVEAAIDSVFSLPRPS